MSWNGSPANPPGLLHAYDLAKNQNAPAVATSEPDRYMVVWEHEYSFNVASYVFWDNESPAVAADIPGYLVLYEGDSLTTNRHIYGRLWWPEAVYLPLVLSNS